MPFLDFYIDGKYAIRNINIFILFYLVFLNALNYSQYLFSYNNILQKYIIIFSRIIIFCNSTDFYVESNSEQKLGFPPGVAEKLVANSMYKWKNIASTLQKTIPVKDDSIKNSNSVSYPNQLTLTDNDNCTLVPPAVQEIEIDSCSESTNINPPPAQSFKTDNVSDSYNGAVRDNYIWTQTLNDLDVLVKIPEHVKISKDTIRVNISSDEVKIDVKPLNSSTDSKWDNIFNGKLSFKIRKDESIWSIEAGKHINVYSICIKYLIFNFLKHRICIQLVIFIYLSVIIDSS